MGDKEVVTTLKKIKYLGREKGNCNSYLKSSLKEVFNEAH